MESREWASYRNDLYDGLTSNRHIIQKLRFECIKVARTLNHFEYTDFSTRLGNLFGTHKEYMDLASDAFWLQRHIAPMWEVNTIISASNLFRISFDDMSVRDRDTFQCRFVSPRSAPVIVYAALSLLLLDLNTYMEEMPKVF